MPPSTALWDVVTGGHHPDGTVIMWGRGVRPGARIADANIMDIAPTALHLLRQPVPGYMDGKVLVDALAPEFTRVASLSEAALPAATATADDGYSDEERALVEERLRNLGYL